MVHRAYNYKYTGCESIRSDQLVKTENGNVATAAIEENTGPTPVISFVQNPVALPTSHSHIKANLSSGSSTRLVKKLGGNQNTGSLLLTMLYIWAYDVVSYLYISSYF